MSNEEGYAVSIEVYFKLQLAGYIVDNIDFPRHFQLKSSSIHAVLIQLA